MPVRRTINRTCAQREAAQQTETGSPLGARAARGWEWILSGESLRGEMPEGPILFVCAVGGHGGPAQSLLEVLPFAAGARRVALGSWSKTMKARLEEGHLCEVIVDMPRPRRRRVLSALRVLRRQIRDERPRVIHANGLTEAALVSFAVWSAGAQRDTGMVVWVHNYEIPRLARFLRPWIRRFPVRSRWCAVSGLAADLVRKGGFAVEVSIVPNPISEVVVAERVPQPDSLPLRVGYLGTDRHYKGFDFLPGVIRATRHLPLEWLMFTGRGGSDAEPWRELDALSAEADIRIEVRGRREPVADAYAECDVVFIPSRQESFCRVAAEAMLNGIPVVASDLRPLRDLLGGDEAGRVFPVGDIPGAARALSELVEDPEGRARMGSAGRIRARRFAPDPIGLAMTEGYRSVAGEPGRD